MEELQAIQPFAGAQVLDGHAADRAHGDRRAAARVAIHLGEDESRQGYALVKTARDIHRFLASHRIGDEQRFRRPDPCRYFGQLVHQLFVNLRAAGSIDDADAGVRHDRRRHATLGYLRRGHSGRFGMDRHVNLPPKRLQLLDGGRAVRVRRNEEGYLAFAPQLDRQFGGRRRLAGAI